MPSFRKVVDGIEYNTLPSPTKEGFAEAKAAASAAAGVAIHPFDASNDFKGSEDSLEDSGKDAAREDISKTQDVRADSAQIAVGKEKPSEGEKTDSTHDGTQQTTETNVVISKSKPRQQEIVELSSDDEEEISLHELAKLKQSGSAKVSAPTANAKDANACSNKATTQSIGIVTNSAASLKNTGGIEAKTVAETGGKSQPTITNAGVAKPSPKASELNGSSTGNKSQTTAVAAPSTINKSTSQPSAHVEGTNDHNTAKSSNGSTAINPPTKAAPPPTQFTTTNGNNSIIAPQTQRPYSSHPTIRTNATAILEQIRNDLLRSMPPPQPARTYPPGPAAVQGMERWSEHRIDSAATVDDLECIRRRLHTLTDRVDARLKEMRFMEAIGMVDYNKENGKRVSIQDMIRKWAEETESKLDVMVKTGDEAKDQNDTLNRKRSQGDSNDTANNAATTKVKRQRIACCPFCLNTDNTSDEDQAHVICAICDERSHMCLNCRVYCPKCNRLTCEDCLMRCDTCLAGIHCSDCMEQSAKCTSCIRKEQAYPRASSTNAYPMASTAVTTFVHNGNHYSHAGKKVGPFMNAQQFIPVAKQGQPQIVDLVGKKTPPAVLTPKAPENSLHRFIITQTGALGLSVLENKNDGATVVKAVNSGGVGEMIGLKQNDVICLPFSNGERLLGGYETFINAAKSRPLIFEVERKINQSAHRTLHRFCITEKGPLGMTVKPLKSHASQVPTMIVSVQHDRLANLHGLCQGDIICKPFSQDFTGVYEWFMEAVKHRPLVFDVWRSTSTRPPTNAVITMTSSLMRTQNPFVWHIRQNNNK